MGNVAQAMNAAAKVGKTIAHAKIDVATDMFRPAKRLVPGGFWAQQDDDEMKELFEGVHSLFTDDQWEIL